MLRVAVLELVIAGAREQEAQVKLFVQKKLNSEKSNDRREILLSLTPRIRLSNVLNPRCNWNDSTAILARNVTGSIECSTDCDVAVPSTNMSGKSGMYRLHESRSRYICSRNDRCE